jgi:hypothetical protein
MFISGENWFSPLFSVVSFAPIRAHLRKSAVGLCFRRATVVDVAFSDHQITRFSSVFLRLLLW